MIWVVFNWLLCTWICYSTGVVIRSICKQPISFTGDVLIGLSFWGIFGGFIAFVFPLDHWFAQTIIFLIPSIGSSYLFKNKIPLFPNKALAKELLWLIPAILWWAWISSGPSLINDDGLYYRQTLLWLKKSGWVAGISNVHVSLGLGSGWHIISALFSMEWLFGYGIYDLNGWLFIIFCIYFIENYSQTKSIQLIIIIGFLSVFSIPFLSAANTDFPVILISLLLADQFIRKKVPNPLLISALIGFLFYIKYSGWIGFLFLLFFVKQQQVFQKSKQWIWISIGFVAFTCGKNIYQTGYGLYPYFPTFSIQSSWKTPEVLLTFYRTGMISWGMNDQLQVSQIEATEQLSITQKAIEFFGRDGIKGWFNKGILILIIIIGINTFYRSIHKGISDTRTAIQWIFIIYGIVWLFTAPQMRFILPILIILLYYIIIRYIPDNLFKINNINRSMGITMVTIGVIAAIIPIPFSSKTSNYLNQAGKVQTSFLIEPFRQYNFKAISHFEENQIQAEHPANNRYCWDCQNPCISLYYHKIIKEHFHMELKLLTKKFVKGYTLEEFYNTKLINSN